MSDLHADELRTADGRVPGRRGMATRQRFLDCTSDLLDARTFRELKVIDIARQAATSPATFYQYFADVEAAILVLAEELGDDTAALAALVREGRWRGAAGYETALSLAAEFLSFWERHRSLLRVIELATGEGDRRFRQVRAAQLNQVTVALSEAIRAARSVAPEEPDPMATAGILVAMLGQVLAHRYGFEFWGIRTDDVHRSMADLIHWSVTGRNPPTRS